MKPLHSLPSRSTRDWSSTLQADLWLNLLVALFLLANPPSSPMPLDTALAGPEGGPDAHKSAVLHLRNEGWVTMEGLPPVALTNLTRLPGLASATNCQIHHPRALPAGALTDLMSALRAKYPRLGTQLVPDDEP